MDLTTPDLEQKFKPDIVAETKLPLSAFNNYFSFGVDAYISLLFDLARRKNPEKFKTRCQNRNYYFGQGSKQWFKRQFQDLMKTVTIHCDGVDLTEYIRVQDPQAVIFLNINSYGGGADPWNKGSRNAKVSQSFSDGLIEVVAMRSCDLACLQLGRKCKAITQVWSKSSFLPFYIVSKKRRTCFPFRSVLMVSQQRFFGLSCKH